MLILNNGFKVRVKQGANVNLKGVEVGQDNPNSLAVYSDKLYTIHFADMYKDGVEPIESIYAKEGIDWDYEANRLGFDISPNGSHTFLVKDAKGEEGVYSIIPNNYDNKGNLAIELSKGKYIALFLEDENLGDSDNPYYGDVHDINVSYTVFKESFELVK